MSCYLYRETNRITQKATLQDELVLCVHTLQSHQMKNFVDCIVCPHNTDKPVFETHTQRDSGVRRYQTHWFRILNILFLIKASSKILNTRWKTILQLQLISIASLWTGVGYRFAWREATCPHTHSLKSIKYTFLHKSTHVPINTHPKPQAHTNTHLQPNTHPYPQVHTNIQTHVPTV